MNHHPLSDLELEANLLVDYKHLESFYCFCTRSKEIGEIFCPDCWQFMPQEDTAILKAMRPGEGIFVTGQRAYAKLERSRRKR